MGCGASSAAYGEHNGTAVVTVPSPDRGMIVFGENKLQTETQGSNKADEFPTQLPPKISVDKKQLTKNAPATAPSKQTTSNAKRKTHSLINFDEIPVSPSSQNSTLSREPSAQKILEVVKKEDGEEHGPHSPRLNAKLFDAFLEQTLQHPAPPPKKPLRRQQTMPADFSGLFVGKTK